MNQEALVRYLFAIGYYPLEWEGKEKKDVQPKRLMVALGHFLAEALAEPLDFGFVRTHGRARDQRTPYL